MYLIRLDDASDKMDVDKWNRIENILDEYHIKPIVGIIPDNKDSSLNYEVDSKFWNRAKNWEKKGWLIAQHGFNHVYTTKNPGINPIHMRSEFAGVNVDYQKRMIRDGYEILKGHGLSPTIFFAPSHTYDKNTLLAIKEETDIRIISDTVANEVYKDGDFFYIPVQSGKMRELPFSTVTFCLLPNMMCEKDFEELNEFIYHNQKKFKDLVLIDRKKNIYDRTLSYIYFKIKKFKAIKGKC